MSDKIASIFMTLFMLIMCFALMTTFQFVNAQKNQDLAEARTSQAVLTTDGTIQREDGVLVKGSEVITALKHIEQIESQRDRIGKDPIYGTYTIEVSGREVHWDKDLGKVVDSSNNPVSISGSADYILKYVDFNNDKYSSGNYVTIKTN